MLGKRHSHEAQPFRGTKRRIDEEQIMNKHMKSSTHKDELQQRKRLGIGSRKITGGLNLFYLHKAAA